MLRYSYAPESETRYRVEVDLSLEAITFGDVVGRHAETLSVTHDLRVVTERLDEHSNGIVAHETANPVVSYQRGDLALETGAIDSLIDGRIQRMRVSPNAEVVERSVSTPSTVSARAAPLLFLLDSAELFELHLPTEAVAVGDSWYVEIEPRPLSGVTDLSRSGEHTYTFRGYAVQEGTVYAVIEAALDDWIEVAPRFGFHSLDGPAMGRAIGTAYFYFNVAQGRLERGSVEYGVVMRTLEDDPITDLFANMRYSLSPL